MSLFSVSHSRNFTTFLDISNLTVFFYIKARISSLLYLLAVRRYGWSFTLKMELTISVWPASVRKIRAIKIIKIPKAFDRVCSFWFPISFTNVSKSATLLAIAFPSRCENDWYIESKKDIGKIICVPGVLRKSQIFGEIKQRELIAKDWENCMEINWINEQRVNNNNKVHIDHSWNRTYNNRAEINLPKRNARLGNLYYY